MILLGKVSPMIGQNFAIGGTSIAAATGVIASLMAKPAGMGGAAGGGAVAAGVSALIGTLVSMATGQTGMDTIAIGDRELGGGRRHRRRGRPALCRQEELTVHPHSIRHDGRGPAALGSRPLSRRRGPGRPTPAGPSC